MYTSNNQLNIEQALDLFSSLLKSLATLSQLEAIINSGASSPLIEELRSGKHPLSYTLGCLRAEVTARFEAKKPSFPIYIQNDLEREPDKKLQELSVSLLAELENSTQRA